MIYTSYFANIKRKNLGSNYKLVSITRINPKGCDIPQCLYFAPDAALLKAYKEGKCTDIEYIAMYKSQMKSLPQDIKQRLYEHLKPYANDPDNHLVLLCYEANGKLCHRHILAQMYKPSFNITEL